MIYMVSILLKLVSHHYVVHSNGLNGNNGELAGTNSFMREEACVTSKPSQSSFTVLPKPSPQPQLLIIFMSRLFGGCQQGKPEAR